eukprot:8817791-Ditylum_brightwellii.AAC.1
MSRILERNKLHLYQAFGTPFVNGTLQQYISKYGSGQGTYDIIEGNFDQNIEENIPAVNYWVRYNICRTAERGSVCVDLAVEEFKKLVNIQDN